MEFLRAVVGDELYTQLEEKVKEYNADEGNKENQIKVGNLGTGNYVDKRKYEDSTGGLQKELDAANKLIEELKASTGDDGQKQKITEYESEIESLKAEIDTTKKESAVKVALLSENAVDVDYLTYKLKESGDKLELDENDNIKGWDTRLTELKTKFPKMFEGPGGKIKVEENKLPDGDGGDDPEPESLEDAIKQQFEKE